MNNFKCFLASNSAEGFVSHFGDCYDPIDGWRTYIIKGGPGTGKSSFMKKVRKEAEEKGVSYIEVFCASDPASLDGLIFPAKKTVFLDGTAPHTTDPVYPGAVERIVNLGEAFDYTGLEKEREDIMALCHAKADAYRTAYRFLAAAGRLSHETDDLLAPVFLSGKAEAAVGRLLLTLKRAKKGAEKRIYISAIGTRGCVKLDTLQKKAKKIYAVTEKNGLEYLFMKHLYAALLREGIEMTVSATPLVREHIEAIYIEREDILFTVMSEEDAQSADKIINSARFASKERLSARRARLRFAEKCGKSLLDGALSSLAEAGRLHDELEAIYGRYMDFSAVERIQNRMISEIFANNM
jgi:hypothetical protein